MQPLKKSQWDLLVLRGGALAWSPSNRLSQFPKQSTCVPLRGMFVLVNLAKDGGCFFLILLCNSSLIKTTIKEAHVKLLTYEEVIDNYKMPTIL